MVNSSFSSDTFRAILEIKLDKMDFLSCTACNEYGCDTAEERMSLLESLFEIIGPEELVEGDDITLECAAVKSHGAHLTWYRQDRELRALQINDGK